MSKSMFLLEVYVDSSYGASMPFKRRISDSVDAIEEWLKSNAQKWASLPIAVECDNYGDGIIYVSNDKDCVLYKFRTTSIAVI